jgi:hypothetical protein
MEAKPAAALEQLLQQVPLPEPARPSVLEHLAEGAHRASQLATVLLRTHCHRLRTTDELVVLSARANPSPSRADGQR